MISRTPVLLSLLLAAPANLLAQAPMDDAMWVAARQGRRLTKVSRGGEVLQSVDLTANGFDLRGVCRAPDGNLWVVNFITTTMTILDRNGGNLQNIVVGGTPFGIAFDRAGDAWITMSNLGRVDRYTPAGVFVQSYTLGPNPLGITIDTAGNVWTAHRNAAPATIGVGRIDGVTGATSTFSMPVTSRLQPIAIIADYRGIGNPSHLWVVGDGSNELVELDNAGTVLNTYLLGTASGLNAVAIDAFNNIWVPNFSNGNVYKVDSTTGSVLLNFLSTPTAIGIGMDAMGHPWVLNRVSFSGPVPSELRRFNATTGTLEVFAPTSSGSPGLTDPAGFQRALVIDQLGDADGDGDVNFGEVLAGTSPYDAQSNSICSLDVIGSTQLGQTCTLVASGAAGVTVGLIGRATGPGLAIPGFIGTLQLDPLGIVGTVLVIPSTPGTLPLTIPNDPSLAGGVLYFQGIHAATSLRFTNTASVVFWP